MTVPQPPAAAIRAVISDVDGTLVHKDKSLSPANVAAVERLRKAGIPFAIVSARPPRGLKAVISGLRITTFVAGFNGGVVASPDLSVISRHLIEPEVAKAAVAAIKKVGADPWVFSGDDWCVPDGNGPRVALEQRTVGFAPTVVSEFSAVIGTAAKIVAVSDDSALLTRLQDQVRGTLSSGANIARSQSYYLDFTHPLANKGHAMQELARLMNVPPSQVAVFGDGENDVAMFDKAGLSIAMGNGSVEVQQAAHFVTGRNDEDGFATAVDWFVLSGKRTALKDVA